MLTTPPVSPLSNTAAQNLGHFTSSGISAEKFYELDRIQDKELKEQVEKYNVLITKCQKQNTSENRRELEVFVTKNSGFFQFLSNKFPSYFASSFLSDSAHKFVLYMKGVKETAESFGIKGLELKFSIERKVPYNGIEHQISLYPYAKDTIHGIEEFAKKEKGDQDNASSYMVSILFHNLLLNPSIGELYRKELGEILIAKHYPVGHLAMSNNPKEALVKAANGGDGHSAAVLAGLVDLKDEEREKFALKALGEGIEPRSIAQHDKISANLALATIYARRSDFEKVEGYTKAAARLVKREYSKLERKKDTDTSKQYELAVLKMLEDRFWGDIRAAKLSNGVIANLLTYFNKSWTDWVEENTGYVATAGVVALSTIAGVAARCGYPHYQNYLKNQQEKRKNDEHEILKGQYKQKIEGLLGIKEEKDKQSVTINVGTNKFNERLPSEAKHLTKLTIPSKSYTKHSEDFLGELLKSHYTKKRPTLLDISQHGQFTEFLKKLYNASNEKREIEPKAADLPGKLGDVITGNNPITTENTTKKTDTLAKRETDSGKKKQQKTDYILTKEEAKKEVDEYNRKQEEKREFDKQVKLLQQQRTQDYFKEQELARLEALKPQQRTPEQIQTDLRGLLIQKLCGELEEALKITHSDSDSRLVQREAIISTVGQLMEVLWRFAPKTPLSRYYTVANIQNIRNCIFHQHDALLSSTDQLVIEMGKYIHDTLSPYLLTLLKEGKNSTTLTIDNKLLKTLYNIEKVSVPDKSKCLEEVKSGLEKLSELAKIPQSLRYASFYKAANMLQTRVGEFAGMLRPQEEKEDWSNFNKLPKAIQEMVYVRNNTAHFDTKTCRFKEIGKEECKKIDQLLGDLPSIQKELTGSVSRGRAR